MDKIELICPKCGGKVDINEKQTRVKCRYCGYEAILVEDKNEEFNVRMVEEESYAKTKGELRAKRQHQRRSTLSGFATTIFVVLILSVIGWILVSFELNSRPLVDPFEYIDVKFTGMTGDGEAEIIKKDIGDDDISPSNIGYRLDKHSNLIEGESVIVEAESEKYRLSKKNKSYKVKGLEVYLYDLKLLDQEALDLLEKKSLGYLDKSIKSFGVDSNLSSYQAKSVLTCLVTNKKEKSKVYEILQVDFDHIDGNKSTKYYVQEYNQVIIRQDPLALVYASSIYRGEMIEVPANHKLTQYFFGYDTLEDAKNGVLKYRESGMDYQEH
ncbi:hypothetical protein [Helcococcus sueciensis]|uniref:hypothetical protein n=1 Tax=Helcococcus sueciensis TaxID=241555 RepID=UPI000409259C|nr:hypothetical protein [Helcococcus sueciensis]